MNWINAEWVQHHQNNDAHKTMVYKPLLRWEERGLVVRVATTLVYQPDVVGSIPVTNEFFLISCDSNQVPKWFGTRYNLEVIL